MADGSVYVGLFECFWIITCRFSSLHLGLFIFLFALANSGVLPHIAGSDTALWIEPTSKLASHSDSCVFHYNTVNSVGYFRFQLNVALILSLNVFGTLYVVHVYFGFMYAIYHSVKDIWRILPVTCIIFCILTQVMETKNMLYLVTEYAKNGEIFGKCFLVLMTHQPSLTKILQLICMLLGW